MEKEAILRLSSLAHPQRLAVFRLLMRRYPQDVSAGEIAQTLAVPGSTLSPYLANLRAAGLIGQRRAGTSLLYHARPDGAGALIDYIRAECCRGRPDLCLGEVPAFGQHRQRVLFLCSGNSARSIMAEAVLRDLGGDRFEVFSAGTRPRNAPHPQVLELLRAKGHDLSPLRAKPVSEFQGDARRMDFVFTVCDAAANETPVFWKGHPVTGHWGLPDPVRDGADAATQARAFEQVYAGLQARISEFVALDVVRLDRAQVQRRVDALEEFPI